MLSVIFFEDIFIPAHRLPQPSVFEEEEQVEIKFVSQYRVNEKWKDND